MYQGPHGCRNLSLQMCVKTSIKSAHCGHMRAFLKYGCVCGVEFLGQKERFLIAGVGRNIS